AQFDLELVDASHQTTHGGSMRYVLAHPGERPVTVRVERLLARERPLGLERIETYERFAGRGRRFRDRLRGMIEELRRRERLLVGYGATAKSTILLNYCGI